MSTIFSKIIAGEIPCHKVAENEDYLAFLDIQPIRMGHVLVIPKKETDYLFDMEDSELGGIMIFAKKVAKAIKEVYPCRKVGVTVIGLEVAHAHVHLLPMNQLHDMDFTKEKLKPSQEELAESARLLSAAYRR
jgi:histidine triad (HIT) family protein